MNKPNDRLRRRTFLKTSAAAAAVFARSRFGIARPSPSANGRINRRLPMKTHSPAANGSLRLLAILAFLGCWLSGDATSVFGGAGPQPGATAMSPFASPVDLDIGETQNVTLHDGTSVRVRLVKVEEIRDRVRGAVRSARVTVEINGMSAELVKMPYTLPMPVAGIQVDCPVVRGYTINSQSAQSSKSANAWGLDKDARLRLWPAGSPWIKPGTFGYPLKQRWFASDTQMSNEPSFVNGSDVPGKFPIYYHFGLDFGGAEGRVEIVSATDGIVVSAGGQTISHGGDSPLSGGRGPRYDVVYIKDGRNWFYRYSHLQTIDVKPGQKVRMGDRLGILGKEGLSGGYAHLHFDIMTRQPSGDWGIQDGYAYVWEAYQREYKPKILAVARPHVLAGVGEKILLDGRKSWSAAGGIDHYEWTFTNGKRVSGAVAAHSYTRPGTYSEILKVTDKVGAVAWDFVVVQVIDASKPKQLPPAIHAAYYPTTGIRVGDPVTFTVRTFRMTGGEEEWNFGDGSPRVRVRSDGTGDKNARDGYAVTEHRYSKPGQYIARVERANARGERAIAHLLIDVAGVSPGLKSAASIGGEHP